MIYEPAEDSFLLQKFVKKYSKGLVLDIGTGSGIQANEAAKYSDFVIGLDINKDAIKYCKKKYKQKDILFLKSNLFEIFEDNFVIWDKIDKKIEIYNKNKLKQKIKDVKEYKKKNIRFDLIIFNPPYLPKDKRIEDKALYGGEKGFEILQRFFKEVKKYLKIDGKVLIVFSSITGKQRINDIINKAGMHYVELEKKHIFFEDIYVYYVAK